MVCSCVHVHATYYLHVHTYQHVTHIHIQNSCNREVGDLFSACFETKKESQAEKDDGQESSHLLSSSAAKPSEPSTYRPILML